MTNTQAVLQALKLIPGATHHAIAEACGLKPKNVQRALELLSAAGKVLHAKLGRINYYFASQEQFDAGIEEVTKRYQAVQAAAKAETKRKDMARQLARYHDKKTLSGEKPGPKPAMKKHCPPPGSLARPMAGGPARIPGEPDFSQAKWTYGKKPPEQTYHSNTHSHWG